MNPNKPCFVAVVPAAGIGTRMQSEVPKQYLKLLGKTVIEHTLETLLKHPQITRIIVVLNPNDEMFTQLPIANHKRVSTTHGGKERVDSVLDGLLAVQGEHSTQDTWVLVHDAARPCISMTSLDDLFSCYKKCDGAILAVPCADTLKQAHSDIENSVNHCDHYSLGIAEQNKRINDRIIARTIDRQYIWQAQTPQFAPLDALINSIQNCHDKQSITDEASALEQAGFEVTLVEGKASNIKITRPDDLVLAEFYISRQQEQMEDN